MQLIPALDLRGGNVVHARGGERSAYLPLQSPLGGSDTLLVVRSLLALHPFRALYVADLDAIERHGDNFTIVRELRRCFPQLELWIDAGFAGADAVADVCAQELGRPVIGSESLSDSTQLERAVRIAGDLILSLDFKGDTFLGPADLIACPALWPDSVIVMSLQRVGSGLGPDLDRLRALRLAAPGKRYYAAGGVRGPADLEALDRLGVAGALIATALHTAQLSPETLARHD